LGEIGGLGSALCWALSNVLFTRLAPHVDAVSINMVRCLVATFFFLLILPFVGGAATLLQASPAIPALLIVSVVLSLALGDSLFLHSMSLIGVSRAFPIANVNPLITLTLAITVLGEHLAAVHIIGSFLILVGISLIARSSPRSDSQQTSAALPGISHLWLGVAMALLAALCWGVTTVVLKIILNELNAVVTNSIRLPMAALMLAGVLVANGRGLRSLRLLSWRGWLILVMASIIGSAAGSFLYLFSIQQAGAGKASVLISTSPLFAVPFSLLILKERVTSGIIVGTILTVIGIGLVVSY
jgi:DME family drug/metabolite transporter